DRRAWLHRRDHELAESRPRPRHEDADVVADLRELDRGGPHPARDADERRHRLHRREEIFRWHDGFAVPLRQMTAHALAELRIGIESSSCRGTADPKLAQLRTPCAQTCGGALDAVPPSAD